MAKGTIHNSRRRAAAVALAGGLAALGTASFSAHAHADLCGYLGSDCGAVGDVATGVGIIGEGAGDLLSNASLQAQVTANTSGVSESGGVGTDGGEFLDDVGEGAGSVSTGVDSIVFGTL